MLIKVASLFVDVDRLLLAEPADYPAQSIKGCRLHFVGGESIHVTDPELLQALEAYLLEAEPAAESSIASNGKT